MIVLFQFAIAPTRRKKKTRNYHHLPPSPNKVSPQYHLRLLPKDIIIPNSGYGEKAMLFYPQNAMFRDQSTLSIHLSHTYIWRNLLKDPIRNNKKN